MKKLLQSSLISTLLISSLSFAGSPVAAKGATSSSGDATTEAATCTPNLAIQKAREITDHIIRINGIDPEKTFSRTVFSADENFFSITQVYDTGLSVPAYTVQFSQQSCFMFDIRYSNLEG